MHKATSCHCVLPPQLPKSLSQSKECKLPGDLHHKVMQSSSSSHASGMAKCRHERGESRIHLNGRMCDFTGIHSVHRRKILLSSPTKTHWTEVCPFPIRSYSVCYFHDTGVHPFRDMQTEGFFLPKLKVIKKRYKQLLLAAKRHLRCGKIWSAGPK